jgi:hypothetical protein
MGTLPKTLRVSWKREVLMLLASNIPQELAQKWEQLTTRHDYGKKQID